MVMYIIMFKFYLIIINIFLVKLVYVCVSVCVNKIYISRLFKKGLLLLCILFQVMTSLRWHRHIPAGVIINNTCALQDRLEQIQEVREKVWGLVKKWCTE